MEPSKHVARRELVWWGGESAGDQVSGRSCADESVKSCLFYAAALAVLLGDAGGEREREEVRDSEVLECAPDGCRHGARTNGRV